MGSFSIWHWVIVLVVVLVLFGGRGKLSQLLGDFAQGINAFRKGMSDSALPHGLLDPTRGANANEFDKKFRETAFRALQWSIIAVLTALVLMTAWIKFA